MHVLDAVDTIMTKKLVTVNPKDKLTAVQEIFDQQPIHHVPVVRFKEIVGMISKSDFLHFLRGHTRNEEDAFVNEARLRVYNAEDIMTKGLAKVSSKERINVALDVFLENRFHAIPVVDDGELVGILTTFDIIKALANTEVSQEDILRSQKNR